MINEVEINTGIIERIRRKDPKTLALVYKQTFPMVLKHVSANSGSKEDAQDVFQDAFYLLIQKTSDPGFELTSQVSTFLVGIVKNLWLKKITQNSIDPKHYQEEMLINDTLIDDEEEVKLERVKHLTNALNSLGEPCKTLLVQYYYFKQTMKEIAYMLHYTNPENAKNQKYKCLQRLKRLVTRTNE